MVNGLYLHRMLQKMYLQLCHSHSVRVFMSSTFSVLPQNVSSAEWGRQISWPSGSRMTALPPDPQPQKNVSGKWVKENRGSLSDVLNVHNTSKYKSLPLSAVFLLLFAAPPTLSVFISHSPPRSGVLSAPPPPWRAVSVWPSVVSSSAWLCSEITWCYLSVEMKIYHWWLTHFSTCSRCYPPPLHFLFVYFHNLSVFPHRFWVVSSLSRSVHHVSEQKCVGLKLFLFLFTCVMLSINDAWDTATTFTR